MREPRIKIFVSHHKPGYIYEDDVYVPIQVGKKNAKIDLGILGDDTGDNISDKNSNYAELTAQYWVWKNYDLSNVDYVGFCHYRRYMTFLEKHTLKDIFIPKNLKRTYDKPHNILRTIKFIIGSLLFFGHTSLLREWNPKIISRESRYLKKYINEGNVEIFLPKTEPIGKFPFKYFGIKNKKLRKVIEDTFIDIYPQGKSAIKKTTNKLSFHRCNIFIMDVYSFKEYSNWLFSFLLELEKRISEFDTSKELLQDGRFMGAFGEFMIDLWLNSVEKNKTIKEKNIILFNI